MLVVFRIMDKGGRPINDAMVLIAEKKFLNKQIPRENIWATGETNNRGCFKADIKHYDVLVRVRRVPYKSKEEVYHLTIHPPHVVDVVMYLSKTWYGIKKYANLYPIDGVSVSGCYYGDECNEWIREENEHNDA